MTTLRDLIQAAKDRSGLGVREIARTAERHGHRLSPSSVSNILNGKTSSVSAETAQALSAVLGIPLEEITTSMMTGPDLGEWVPPVEARSLTGTQRRLIEDVIRQFSEGNTARSIDEESHHEKDIYKFAARRNPTGRFDTDGTGSDISS